MKVMFVLVVISWGEFVYVVVVVVGVEGKGEDEDETTRQ